MRLVYDLVNLVFRRKIMRGVMKFIGLLSLPLLVLGVTGNAISQTAQQPGNPAVGAELYDTCVPCHTLNGNGVAGLPIPELMSKMKAYQNGSFTDPKVIGMQQVLQPLSDQQLLDLATYMTKM